MSIQTSHNSENDNEINKTATDFYKKNKSCVLEKIINNHKKGCSKTKVIFKDVLNVSFLEAFAERISFDFDETDYGGMLTYYAWPRQIDFFIEE